LGIVFRDLNQMGKGALKIPARKPSSNKAASRYSVKRRGGGAVPGPRPKCDRLSDELEYRSQSILEEIRRPPLAKQYIRTWKIVRGDLVQVIQPGHNQLGQQGYVLEVLRQSSSLLVKGVNYKKALKLNDDGTKTRVTTESPIHVHKVALVCPKMNRATPVTYKYLEDGTRVRVATISGEIIPKPEAAKALRSKRPVGGPKDTPAELVLKHTYVDDGLVSLLKECGLKTEMLETAPAIPPLREFGENR